MRFNSYLSWVLTAAFISSSFFYPWMPHPHILALMSSIYYTFIKFHPSTFQDQHLLPFIRFNSYLLWALNPTFVSYTSYVFTWYETHLLPVVRITSYFSWTLPPSFHRLHLPPIMGSISYFHEFHLRPFVRSTSYLSWVPPLCVCPPPFAPWDWCRCGKACWCNLKYETNNLTQKSTSRLGTQNLLRRKTLILTTCNQRL